MDCGHYPPTFFVWTIQSLCTYGLALYNHLFLYSLHLYTPHSLVLDSIYTNRFRVQKHHVTDVLFAVQMGTHKGLYSRTVYTGRQRVVEHQRWFFRARNKVLGVSSTAGCSRSRGTEPKYRSDHWLTTHAIFSPGLQTESGDEVMLPYHDIQQWSARPPSDNNFVFCSSLCPM